MAMKGTRPGKLPPPTKATGDGGRVCSAPGCTTRLSKYNVGDRCWQHADLTFPNFRGKRLNDPND
jgi:hypothetical protein